MKSHASNCDFITKIFSSQILKGQKHYFTELSLISSLWYAITLQWTVLSNGFPNYILPTFLCTVEFNTGKLLSETYFLQETVYLQIQRFGKCKKKNPSTLITKNDEVSAPEQSIHQSFVSSSSLQRRKIIRYDPLKAFVDKVYFFKV